MSTGNIPPESVGFARAEEDEERGRRTKTKAGERNSPVTLAEQEGTARKRDPRTASHVATVATYSRARTYVFIATGALSAGLERKRGYTHGRGQREREEDESNSDGMELRVCEDYWRQAC